MKTVSVFASALMFLLALPAYPEIVIRAKDGKFFRVPIDGNDVASIDFISGQPSPGLAPMPSGFLEGEWGSSINLVYKIIQDGNSFTWRAEKIHENASGTISGGNLSVSWQGDWGNNSATGKITAFDHAGRAVRIDWSNGVYFTRK